MKILLVRLDGIGDALACTPLVAALRDAGHQLGIALTRRNAAIFARDTFAWTHVLERRPWPAHGHAAADIEKTVRESAEAGYELALVASEEPDAYALAARCAPRRIGFVNGWEKPFKTLASRHYLQRAIVRSASAAGAREHEAETLFRLGTGLHGERAPSRDVQRLRPLVCDAAAERRGISVQLTPKWNAFGIRQVQLAELVRSLATIAPLRLLVSSQEAAELRALGVSGDGIDAAIFEGDQGMHAWKRAIAEAAVLVTPDTGAAHVAGMTGTPCVDLFEASRYVSAQMRRWKPWASPSALLIADRDAPIVEAARDLLAPRVQWPKSARL